MEIQHQNKSLKSMALFAEMNPEPVLRFTGNGEIVKANPAAAICYKEKDIVGKNIFDFQPELKKIDFNKLIATNEIQTVYLKSCDRHYQYILRGINEFNVCQMYGSDITEKVNAQKEAESMALFAELNPEPVFRIDKQGEILQSNLAANNIFKEKSLVGNNIKDVLEEIKTIDFVELISKNKIATITSSFQIKLYSKSVDEVKTFRFIIRGISKLKVCQIYGSDITERIETQKQLESMALFAKLNPEPVIRFDENGIILQSNPAANKSFGKESIIGFQIKDLLRDIENIDIRSFIQTNKIETVDIENNNIIYRYILKGVSELGVCHMYGSDITKRVKAEEEVKDKQKTILDSIQYARRIQNAVLPSTDLLEKYVRDHFILYMPKDIVSGDFYWMAEKDDTLVLVAADCTGHGVPGGFMSMLGISLLNELVHKQECTHANIILNELRRRIKRTLSRSGKSTDDGMDMSFVMLNPDNGWLQFAGAYNSLYLYRGDELIQLRADKMPIGNHLKDHRPFTNHHLKIKKNDVIYIMSDGYVDQFGENMDRKLTIKNLKEILVKIKDKPMNKQKDILEKGFHDWKKSVKQIDDILIIGVRV